MTMTDVTHDLEALGAGAASCTCGWTGNDGEGASGHAREHGMCGECWGGGTDAYPCLGTCPGCGGSGEKADEERLTEIYAKAEAEIDAALAGQEA
jgi:hypothetical protein